MRFSVRPNVTALALLLAGGAGTLAVAYILSDLGIHAPWMERFRLQWFESSNSLADRAYREFLSGRRSQGLELFRLALRRDPASPYRWCDYGEMLLLAGDKDGARRAIQRGLELGPHVAAIRMRAVNFAYRTEESAGALEQGCRLLAITEAYDDAVFQVWNRMELPAVAVLRSGIPDRRAAQSYLRRLMGEESVADARQAWDWLLARSYLDGELADEYARFLLGRREFSAASEAWAAYWRGREPDYPHRNAVFNGGFEWEPAGKSFDWRIDQAAGVRIDRHGALAAAGRYSLRIRFDGTENIAFGHVSQQVVVDGGRWRFEASVRTEDLTTREGIGFRILNPEAPGRLDLRTEALTGTHDWVNVTAAFTVPAAQLIEIRIVRNPSSRFDNKIRGTVWVDAVALRQN